MIRQAVILAAGCGTRMRLSARALPKPLQRANGISLLTRTILTLRSAGAERIYIVCGFMADALRAGVVSDPHVGVADLEIEWVYNRDWELANGVSALEALDRVDGPCVLSMSDHVYDSALPGLAASADMAEADLYLCVDRRIDEVYDIDDATKVRTRDGRIDEIGKELTDYDAIDCGVFSVGRPLLACLRDLYHARGDCSLSDGVRRLAELGRARVLDIGDAFWQDVDTPAALARAEAILRRREKHVRTHVR